MQWRHLEGEEQEAGEGAEAALVEDALLRPHGDGEPVALLQLQRHAVGGTAVAPPSVEDGEHVDVVLEERHVEGARAAHAACQADVVEARQRRREDPWEATRRSTSTALLWLARLAHVSWPYISYANMCTFHFLGWNSTLLLYEVALRCQLGCVVLSTRLCCVVY